MQNSFNKKIIANNFSKAASIYDDNAIIQKIAAQNLTSLIENFLKNDCQILDLGSGTGFMAQNIGKINNKIKIFETDLAFNMLHNSKNHLKIQSDFEKLPFKNNSFNIITSAFALQWLNDFDNSFLEFSKILNKNGILAFSIPTNESLAELKKDNFFNFVKLPTIDKLELTIKKLPFQKITLKKQILEQNFENPIAALKSLKKIGANYNDSSQNKIDKNSFKKFDNFYLKNFSNNNRNFKISWHIAYFILQKI